MTCTPTDAFLAQLATIGVTDVADLAGTSPTALVYALAPSFTDLDGDLPRFASCERARSNDLLVAAARATVAARRNVLSGPASHLDVAFTRDDATLQALCR